MIRSNPVGAAVHIDDHYVGVTPVATNYTYYGTRKIRLEKPGYETLTILQPVPAPWYQVPPLDFFTDNLVINQIRDERTLEYQLVPQVVVPTEQLRARAEELRRGTQANALPGANAPPGAIPGQPISPFVGPGPQTPLERVAPPTNY